MKINWYKAYEDLEIYTFYVTIKVKASFSSQILFIEIKSSSFYGSCE